MRTIMIHESQAHELMRVELEANGDVSINQGYNVVYLDDITLPQLIDALVKVVREKEHARS